jgi:hypothetical protein
MVSREGKESVNKSDYVIKDIRELKKILGV